MLTFALLISRSKLDEDLFRELFKEAGKVELEDGLSYIIKERRNKKGMLFFTKLITKGYQGLYITRQHPKHISKTFDTNGMNIVWLSTTLGNNYVDPHNISTLLNMVKNFVEIHDKSVIFLDGVEYLMINNVYNRVVRLIEQIKDMMVQANSIFLISVDERAFEPKELSLLEKGLKPVDT